MVKAEVFGDYPAVSIASAAMTESLNSYKDRIARYRELGCSYIPIPTANKYYSIEEQRPVDLVCEQRLLKETHLLTVMSTLAEYPFVLLEESGLQLEPAPRPAPDGSRPDSGLAIATAADINRTPTTQMLCPYLLELEAQLAHQVSQYYRSKEIPKDQLSEATRRRWETSKQSNIELALTDYFTLSDYYELIIEDDMLMAACGFESADEAESTFDKLIKLDQTVHARDRHLVESQGDVRQLLSQIQETHRLKRRLD